MKRRNYSGKSATVFFVVLFALSAALLLTGGAITTAHAFTTEDCRVCHTGGVYGSVAQQHHATLRSCGSCHFTAVGAPEDFFCETCHYPDSLKWKALDVTAAHTPLHDKTDVPDPLTCDISCHNPAVIPEHQKYPIFAAATGEMDCDRCHKNTNTDPQQGPINVQETIVIGSGASGQVVTCDQCHTNISAQGHALSHDNVLPDSMDCTAASCHNANVMTEHTNRGWTCGTCHSGETLSLDPALVQQVIATAAGPLDQTGQTTAYCTSCHGPDAGNHAADHDQGFFLQTPSGQDCTRCHAATDPTINPNRANLVEEHVTNRGLVCATCHDRVDHVFDTINKGRTPSSLPVYCVDCHTDATTGQGTGHNPVTVDPWSECTWCHTLDIFEYPEHTMHLSAAQDLQKDCSVCHVPLGTRPDCSSCHSLDQTIWDPLPIHRTEPNNSLNIIGPGTEDHDKHTSGIECSYCHESGVPGSEPLPVPYSECSKCHNGATATDIAYGSTVHTVNHIQGAEAVGQSCSYCHSPAPSCTACHDIAGPNKPKHDTHTDTFGYNCVECHINGVAGSEPLPAPYNECSTCHNPAGPGSDIIYGSTIHTESHIGGGETSGQSCDLCHGPAEPDCAACHAPGHPPMTAPFDTCATCHDGTRNTTNIAYGEVGHNVHMLQANNVCSTCHTPQPDCSACHLPGHDPVPAQFSSCDASSCHVTLQPTQQTHEAHKLAATTNNIVDCTICHSAQATCADCHTPGHEPVPAAFSSCDSCHTTLPPGQPTHEAHKAAATSGGIVNCTICHSAQATCADCHSPGHPEITAFDACAVCHTDIQPGSLVHNNHRTAAQQDCTVCHTPTTPDCSQCHTGTTHDPVPAAFMACDTCHTSLVPGQATHESHKAAATTGGIVNCATCHSAQATCADCHSPGHPEVPAPYNTCDQCHTDIQPGSVTHTTHRTQAGQDCTVCHTAQPNCGQCHTAGHEPVPVQFQACDSCHTTLQPPQAGHEAHKAAATSGGTVNCAACHSPQATCADCHSPGHPEITAYDECTVCHTDIQPGSLVHNNHRAAALQDCTVCHTPTTPDCSQCHTGTTHTPIPAPNDSCDDCHATLQPGQATHEAHKAAATTGGIVNCALCHTASPPPDCGQCHTAGDHAAAHDNAGVPSMGCTNCHDANVVVEHVDNRGFECATCHASTSQNVIDAIAAGQAGTTVTCYDCHGQNMHHDNANATSGNCVFCHADPRPLTNDPKQLACRECHVDANGFVKTGAGKPSHAFNTNGNIKDFGACFNCHAPMPYHGKPQQAPECWTLPSNSPYYIPDQAPGRGTFNIFNGEFRKPKEYYDHTPYKDQAKKWCKDYENSFRSPQISFNWFPIVYQGQSMNVPAFDPAQQFPPHSHSRINTVGNCGDCHTVGTVVPVTHNNNCIGCHFNPSPTVQDVIAQGRSGATVDCFDCHGSQDHVSAHDMTELTEPNCSECHVGNVFTEHVVNRTLTCSDCHSSTDPNVQNAIANGMSGQPVPCQDCHGASAGDHLAAHDSVGVPSTGCTGCHDANVVTEHVTNRSFTCATCHDNPAYTDVINTGKAGTYVTCFDCHGQAGSVHHDNENARTGNCTYCHGDPRLEIDPKAPTGQLACRQCHTDTSGMVTATRADHRYNTQGAIQDFGACFACHQPTPYHAKPTQMPSSCNASLSEAPGKGSFNLFYSELGGRNRHNGGEGRNERNKDCKDRESRYNNPAIQYNMVTFFDYINTNQQWSVPYFGTGGGTEPPPGGNDTISITRAEYKDHRLEVHAENDLGNNATLTLSYEGRDYQMNWNKDKKRWEIRIDDDKCTDSTIEVTSSAGGTASRTVSGDCSSGGGSTLDTVTITRADYSGRRDRLTVYAENSLGNSAQLTVHYDGDTYQMSWDSRDNRFEIRISASSCRDDLIEVTSSEGGSDSAYVSGCGN